MKQKLTILCIFTTFSCVLTAKQAPIKLTSPVIEFIDGKSWGINGETIGYMRQVGLNVVKMQHGVPQKDSTIRIGLFDFEGKKYSIKELLALSNKPTYLFKKEEYDQFRIKLKECLAKVKEYFIEHVKPFMAQAQGAKQQVIILIREWAEKRNRTDSHLLRWAQEDDNNEFTLFRKEVNSFEELDKFCSDLISYLTDLIYSCPKANAQFEQLKEQFLAQQRQFAL